MPAAPRTSRHTTLGALALIAAATCPSTNRAEQPADTLTIATYNINWGNIDLKTMVGTVRRADADVVCLQETNQQSERYIRRALRKEYSAMRFRGHRGRWGAERFGFLSRHPVSHLSFVEPKQGLFGAYVAQVRTRGTAIQIVNVHLQPIVLPRDAGIAQALSALAAMEQTHANEIAHIFEHVRPDMPTVFAGDFNSLSTFHAPLFLKKKGFVDSFAQTRKHPDAGPTWRWGSKSGEWSFRLDYIFHSRHLATTASAVLKSDASDHYLLTSTLRLAPAEEKHKNEDPAGAAAGSQQPPDSGR